MLTLFALTPLHTVSAGRGRGVRCFADHEESGKGKRGKRIKKTGMHLQHLTGNV
jgi:hypothetical protein